MMVAFLLTVSGLGFGIISGAFSLINVLADSTGPGTVGIHDDSGQFFITSGACYSRSISREREDFCHKSVGNELGNSYWPA